MKRILPLWLGLLAFAAMPVLAQQGAPTGKIHGQVINPTGAPQNHGYGYGPRRLRAPLPAPVWPRRLRTRASLKWTEWRVQRRRFPLEPTS